MYIDKMSDKSDDSSNCIYSARSGCKQQSKASFHHLVCAGLVLLAVVVCFLLRAVGRNPVLMWIRSRHDHLGNFRGYGRKTQRCFYNNIRGGGEYA